MSSEEAEETPVVEEEAEEVVKSNSNKKERNKKDETPIEELYDLSKPIPKVDRPNKTEHEEALKVLTDAVEALKVDRQKVQTEIDEAMNDPDAKAKLQEARTELNTLKNEKNNLINEKKAMRSQLDDTKNQTEKLIKDKKDARSNIKFSSVEEIEAEISRLKRKQETTTMSLNDEKRLIKDMEALQASKKYVADLKSKDAAMEGVKEQRKTIAQQISLKDKEIDEVSKKIDTVMATIKEINDKETKKRDSLQELFKKRDDIRKVVADKLKEKDALRDDFREKSNAWYNNQRAVRAQKKLAYEEEKRKREEEKAAYLAKLEEEEAKKIPYEEEQALCEYLADYLERTYLSGKSEQNEDGSKKEDVVVATDDPFAGLKPVNKKSEDEYFGKGKSKKKRVRAAKKQDSSAGPFTLSVDTFEQFGLITLSPPTSLDQVENSVKELREKKEWYKEQPRGSVPTAAEIRKANEKAAAKLRQENGDTAKAPKQSNAFNLSNDDFVPLGDGGGATKEVNSSWGQKPSTEAPESAAQEAS